MEHRYPADDEPAPHAALAACPAALLHAARVASHPGLAMRRVEGMHRGLFASAPFRAGAVLAREAAVCWEEELVPANDAGERTVTMWRHPVLSTSGLIAIAYQMAPFHGARVADGSCNGRPTHRVVDSDGGALPTVSRFELLRATLAANSFAVTTAPRAAGDAAAAGGGGGGAPQPPVPAPPGMHLSAAGTLEHLCAAYGVTGRALFPVLGLANHACDANAKVCEVRAGDGDGCGPPVYELEARADIPAGAEVTIAYVPRSWPRARRQAELAGTWGFTCACARCAVDWDDTVVLRCGSAACAGSPAGGRVFHGKWTCEDCGADVRAEAAAAAVQRGGSEGEAERSAAALAAADGYDLEADLWAHCCHPPLPRPPGRDVAGARDDREAHAGGGGGGSNPTGGAVAGAGDDARGGDDAPPAPSVWALSPPPLAAIADRLLRHPLLAPEDRRVFAALCRLTALLQEAVAAAAEAAGEGEGEGAASEGGGPGGGGSEAEALLGRVVGALALAAMRCAFACPGDLGIEVEEAGEDEA